MNPAAHDDEFAALLAACDEALARRDLAEIEKLLAEHPQLAERLKRGRQCIQLLQQELGSDLGLPDARLGAGSAQNLMAMPDQEGAGSVIGPYKLLQEIGEGGFGVVYMAAQLQPVRRKVALKIIKPGMDTREVIARFEAERQALAMMDHPNIARVLDAGATESGRPYFVMELVKGVPITEFCARGPATKTVHHRLSGGRTRSVRISRVARYDSDFTPDEDLASDDDTPSVTTVRVGTTHRMWPAGLTPWGARPRFEMTSVTPSAESAR